MLLRCGGTWERAGLEVAEEDLSQWYWEVIKPKSPYVIREGDDTRGKKRALAKGKGMVSSDEEEVEEPVVSGGGGEGTGKKKNGAGHPVLAKGKGRTVGGKGDEGPAGGEGTGLKKGGTRPSALAKGKGRVVSGEGNGEQAEGSRSGGRGKAVGSKDPLPLMVRLPVPSQGLLSLKADNVMWSLQAKVQRLENELRKELDEKEDMRKLVHQVQTLEDALRMEEERTEHLVESKARYKGRVAELTGKQAAALDRIQELEAAVEEGESDRSELQRELEEAWASGGAELEMLKPAVEEYSKERADYMEWKATGTRRMELARELAGVEEDRARLWGRVLQLERECKEYEIWQGTQEAKVEALEEELQAVEEYGEVAQAHVLELVRDSVGKSKISLVFNSDLI